MESSNDAATDTLMSNTTSYPQPPGSVKSSHHTYSERLKFVGRRKRCSWVAAVVFICLLFLLMVVGLIVLLSNHFGSAGSTKRYMVAEESSAAAQKAQTQDIELVYKFEYLTDSKKDEVIINVNMNFTEVFAEDITVFNYFNKELTMLRVTIAPGLEACLVKPMGEEVPPLELRSALSQLSRTSINVNGSEAYGIDSAEPPTRILEDIRVYQYCHGTKVYMLKSLTESSPDNGITMEVLIKNAQEMIHARKLGKRSVSPLNSLDKHSNPPYYCGGPIGVGVDEPQLSQIYTCTKEKKYCYRSLVNDQCDECYHGHNLRTRGCWCPIRAVETCVKVSYKPDDRQCCEVDIPPCVRHECETLRLPSLPTPIITFKIIPPE